MITEAPVVVERGTTFRVRATAQSRIVKARLVRPSAVTRQTDTKQRSVALDITSHCPPGDKSGECCKNGCDLDLSLPELEGIVPSGPYMLMLDDADGVPSKAAWIRVK